MPKIIAEAPDGEIFSGDYNVVIANIRSMHKCTVQQAHDYLMATTEEKPFVYRDGTKIWIEE